MKRSGIAVFVTAILVNTGATAQQAIQPNKDTEELVVHGSNLSSNEALSVKAPTPIIDVPQSLSIISAEQITEQGITSVGDIIEYTPGANTSQGEGHRDSVVFRGVRSTADFYLDGNRDDVQYFRGLYNLEQVEILRGPNALLFGRGGTGGVLNRVTKKATIGENFTGYKATANTFGGVGIELDHNFLAGEKAAVRINFGYESLENHRDFFDGERIGFNPTARFELSDATTLDLSYEYADHERFIDRGIPNLDGAPIEAFEDITFADPDFNETTLEAHILRAALTHRFSDNVKGNFSAFYGDYDKVYANLFPTDFDASNNAVELDGYLDETDRQNFVLSANVVSEFFTGIVGHTLVFGGEYIDTSSDQFRFNAVFDTTNDDNEFFSVSRPLSFSNGTGINAAGDPTTVSFTDLNDDTRVGLQVASIYVQDQIALSEKLDIVLGARFDSFDIDVLNVPADDFRTRRDDEVSPRLGIIYKPVENVSIYGSFSESFLPRSGEQFANINGDNDDLDPNTFSNLEFGVKWDFASGLSLAAAIFENEQSSPQVDDNDAGAFVIVDSEISGFEIQLSGQVTDYWSLTAGYGNLDGEQVNQSGPTGLTPRELPEDNFSIWNSFQLSSSFGLGLGLTYQGESFSDNGNSTTLPDYTRIDASAYYDVSEKLRLQVNIENLTDELYFPNSHTANNITVGAPINALFTVTGAF